MQKNRIVPVVNHHTTDLGGWGVDGEQETGRSGGRGSCIKVGPRSSPCAVVSNLSLSHPPTHTDCSSSLTSFGESSAPAAVISAVTWISQQPHHQDTVHIGLATRSWQRHSTHKTQTPPPGLELVHEVALNPSAIQQRVTAARAAMTRCIFPSSPSFISFP